MATLSQLQAFADGPTGQLLLQGGQAVAGGADPSQVAAGLAMNLAEQGQTQSEFLNSSAGQLVQQYVGQVAGGDSVVNAFQNVAGPAVTIGLTVGLGAVGIPPPLSTLIAGGISSFIAGPLSALFSGPIDKTYGSLGGDFAWRARKYHTNFLPQAFVTYMEANGFSLSGACLNPPSGEAPPWSGMSQALASWLMAGAWDGRGFILLPGYTDAGGGFVNQFGINYKMLRNAGDGWNVFPAGWWWYPYLSDSDLVTVRTGHNIPNAIRGPLIDAYDAAGIDFGKTVANVLVKGPARVENVVYKPIAYTLVADELEQAASTDRNKRDWSQRNLLDKAGGERNAGAAIAALGAAALLFR